MPSRKFETIGEYIASQPASVRRVLSRVRSTIRKAVPQATEVISYSIPAYRMPGGIVLYFAAWTHHYSLYPAIGGLATAFKAELAPYKLSKGTIRFPFDAPVPVRLIARIAKFRAQAVAERAKSKRRA